MTGRRWIPAGRQLYNPCQASKLAGRPGGSAVRLTPFLAVLSNISPVSRSLYDKLGYKPIRTYRGYPESDKSGW